MLLFQNSKSEYSSQRSVSCCLSGLFSSLVTPVNNSKDSIIKLFLVKAAV